jgi:hypothetical protein
MSTEDPPPTVPPLDVEVAALERCFRTLLPFDVHTRQRILEYLDSRLLREPMREPEPNEREPAPGAA